MSVRCPNSRCVQFAALERLPEDGAHIRHWDVGGGIGPTRRRGGPAVYVPLARFDCLDDAPITSRWSDHRDLLPHAATTLSLGVESRSHMAVEQTTFGLRHRRVARQ